MAKDSARVTWEAVVVKSEGRPLQLVSTFFPATVSPCSSHRFNPYHTHTCFHVMEMMSATRLNSSLPKSALSQLKGQVTFSLKPSPASHQRVEHKTHTPYTHTPYTQTPPVPGPTEAKQPDPSVLLP